MAITNTGIVERTITGVNDGSELFPDNTTSTTTNTGIVERGVTGVNESELWLDAESTSSVTNTGIVERSITGVNESDEMFPNNTISNIINLAGNLLIGLFNAFKTRVSADGGTLDNEIGLDVENFDDTASLTMLPNAYNEGVLYSVLPEGGAGDFDVVRGSSATRVNAEGLIEDIRRIGSDLITNGDFSNGATDWELTGAVNVSNSVCNFTASGAKIVQRPNLTQGRLYKITFDILNYTSGISRVYLGSTGDASFTASANGSYSFILEAEGTTDIIQWRSSGGAFIGSIDNCSVKEVIDATNIPRIDYTSGSPVLLTEPQSTNLVASYNVFNAISGGSVSNNELSPDGTLNAIKVSFGTGVNSGATIQVAGSSVTPSTDYTVSFYAKSFSGDGTFRLRLDTDTQTNFVNENFTATSEWVRYTHTFTTDAASSSFTSSSRFRKSTDNNEVLFYGAQLEEGSFATSLIPTNGTIATRLRDLVTMAGDLSTFNTDEGVLFAEITEISPSVSNNYISLNIGGSASQQFNNSIGLNFRNADKRVKAEIRVNGSEVATQDQNNFTLPIKAAIRYSASEMALYVNGGLVKTTKVPAAWFPSGTLTQVDFDRGGSSFPFFGRSKGVRTYNTALTDAEMITLTTI